MEKLHVNKEFITVDELAEIMCISTSYAYEYVRRAPCPFKCLKLGRRYLIPTNSFYKWYDNLEE